MNDLSQVQFPIQKQHGNCELYHGDCRQILPRLSERPKFIFADPPFNIGHGYNGFDDSKSKEEYDEFTQQWLHAVEDQLDENGILAVNVPDDLVLPILQHCRLQRIAWVNWHYRFGQCGRSNWINSKVHCLIFAKNPKSFTWNPDEVLVTSDRAST
jgi:DNA modification methylase